MAADLALPLEIAARPRTWDDFQGAREVVGRVRELAFDKSKKLVIVVLYGKSGRGKTTLCKIIGSSPECKLFHEINASSERKGEDLRDAFDCFLASIPAPQVSPPQPCCPFFATLFMDEADGLGDVGQLTMGSFVSMLQRKEPHFPIRILFACNDVARMDKGILQRADAVLEMPRPSREDLVSAARRAAGHEVEGCEGWSVGGDFRVMLQMAELASVNEGREFQESLVCPKEFAHGVLSSFADNKTLPELLDLVKSYWDKGFREDVIIVWVEQIVTVKMTDRIKHALLMTIHDLHYIQPVSLLQVYGVFIRNCRVCQNP
jgi:hypothetical protein